jgi:iron complex outermembrane receptor protein
MSSELEDGATDVASAPPCADGADLSSARASVESILLGMHHMKTRLLHTAGWAALLAAATLPAGGAFAQSTATQEQEKIVVTGQRVSLSAGGLATPVQDAKDIAVVDQEYFKTQVPTANAAQLVNLLPGVTYSTEDPTGILSSDFRIHGFDGNHVSIQIDGAPVNDTGNYASFPGEYLIAELTDHINVNMGATDVDSPTASAVGGQINIITKKPSDTFQVIAKGSGGDYNYKRAFVEIDPGDIGGFTSFFSANWADGDKWKGKGEVATEGFDARIYKQLDGKDFLSLSGTFRYNTPTFYQSYSRQNLINVGRDFDYNTIWVPLTIQPGKADVVPSLPATNLATAAGNDTQYWGLHPNPVKFGIIRGSSLFDLGGGFSLTFDPSLFYTLANGGGSTAISESDPRLKGAATTFHCPANAAGAPVGVDLNGDGDCQDTVPLYTPNNTETVRFGVGSSLLWDMDEHNHFQVAYTLDYGRHHQTGQYTFIDLTNGKPDNLFGGINGYGPSVIGADGSILRGRDRFSIAMLNQIAANYLGKFLDNRLHINVGFRAPFFERDLNQHCYTFNGTSAYCDTVAVSAVQNAYNLDLAANRAPGVQETNLNNLLFGRPTGGVQAGQGGVPNFRFPFSQTFNFNQVLPSAGADYHFDDYNQVYVSYAKGFSAPKTDDLYSSSPELVTPETSDEYGAGYRFQTSALTASVNLWETDYKNRIVQSFDPNDSTLSIDRNVGSVTLRGVDLEGAWKATDKLFFYASTSYTNSHINHDYVGTGGVFVPTTGKQLVMTPEWQFAGRAQYEIGGFDIGFQGKYIAKRYVSDVNDSAIGGFAVFDLDTSYEFNLGDHSFKVQGVIDNIFDRDYISRVSTVANVNAVTVPSGTLGASPLTSGPFYFIGAPRTFFITLTAKY